MKLVWKLAILWGLAIMVGSCNNGPSPEELRLAQEGALATLVNKPDPEKLRMENVVMQFETFMTDKLEELDLPGAAYAIVKNGEVVSMQTYGVRKKGKSEEIDEHTVFRLASVSKGFASVLAGLLVDQNYIGWNDKIKDHLPRFKLRKSASTDGMTIRHTLSQTTGLRKYAGSSAIYKGLSYPSILRSLRSAPIEDKPAKVYAYQNAIFSAISEVGKAVTDLSYEELLDSMIFKPLEMEDASAGYKAMIKTENKGYPHVFSKRRGWRSGNIRKNWYNVGPAAGVNASISDMAIWLKAMLGHYPAVIPDAVRHEIFKRHIAMNEDSGYYESWFPGLAQASYGMGWRIFDYNEHKIIYHGGYVRGYRPEIGFCPKEDVGIVFLTNASKNELSSACIKAFFDIYFAPKVTS